MAKKEDNVCCKSSTCICEDDTFTTFYNNLPPLTLNQLPNDKRRECYKEAARLLTREEYAPLPSCVVWQIRRKYQEEDHIYTGFSPKDVMIKQINDAQKTFQKDMQKYLDVVSLVHPETGLLTAVSKLGPDATKLQEILQMQPAASTSRDDPYLVKPAIDFLPQLAVVTNAVALEAFFEEMKLQCVDIILSPTAMCQSDFNEWLDSRLSNDQFIAESDKQFFEGYLEHEITKVNRKNLFSELSSKLKNYPLAPDTINLTQTVLNYKKKQIRTKDKKPTLHDLRETFVKVTERKLKPQQPIELPSAVLGKRHGQEDTDATVAIKRGKSGSKNPQTETRKAQQSTSKRTSLTGDDNTSKEKKIRIEIQKGIESLIMFILKEFDDQQKSWQIWRQESGDSADVVPVQCKSYSGLAHLSNLFYGLRSLFAHGTTEYTIQTGVLSKKHAPEKPDDFDIRGQNESEKADCEKYLLHLWNEATEKGNNMTINCNLFRTMHSFYTYFAAVVGRICQCVAFGLCDKRLLQKTSDAGEKEIKTIRDLLKNANWPVDWQTMKTSVEATMSGAQHSGLTQDFDAMSIPQQ